MPRKPRKTVKPRETFHPWELVFLTGRGAEGLDPWQEFGLRDLKRGKRARPQDRTPEELIAAWKSTGQAPFKWEDEEDDECQESR